MSIRYLFLFFILILINCPGRSQIYLKEAINQVNEHKVQEYLKDQINNNIVTFTDIQPSLNPREEVNGFKRQILDYGVNASLGDVWNHYVSTPPNEAWNSRKINVDLLFNRKKNEIFYSDDLQSSLDTNQVIYLDLSFLFGFYKLAMAFEITRIDIDQKLIEFSYIKGNQSEGKQQLQFIGTKRGNTIIEHTSFYRSKSFLRDRLLYPYFHKKLTDDFHKNMRQSL